MGFWSYSERGWVLLRDSSLRAPHASWSNPVASALAGASPELHEHHTLAPRSPRTCMQREHKHHRQCVCERVARDGGGVHIAARLTVVAKPWPLPPRRR